MHLLVVSFKNGTKQYVGPFPTFFKANEYGKAIMEADRISTLVVGCTVTALTLPVTMRVKFK